MNLASTLPLLCLIWKASTQECNETAVEDYYVYKKILPVDIKIYYCLYNDTMLTKYGNKLVGQSSNNDVTENCLNSFKFKAYTKGKYHHNVKINGTLTHHSGYSFNGNQSVSTVVSVTLQERTAKADLITREIKLPSGFICKYRYNNTCYDPIDHKNFVWKSQNRMPLESCQSYLLLRSSDFKKYIVTRESRRHLILERNKKMYRLDIKKLQHIKCGRVTTWETNQDDLFISKGPIEGDIYDDPLGRNIDLNVLLAEEKTATSHCEFETATSTTEVQLENTDNDVHRKEIILEKAEEEEDDEEDFDETAIRLEKLKKLGQKAKYVLYVCFGILAYIVVDIALSLVNILKNYALLRPEVGLNPKYLFQCHINRFYVKKLDARRRMCRKWEDDTHEYATIN